MHSFPFFVLCQLVWKQWTASQLTNQTKTSQAKPSQVTMVVKRSLTDYIRGIFSDNSCHITQIIIFLFFFAGFSFSKRYMFDDCILTQLTQHSFWLNWINCNFNDSCKKILFPFANDSVHVCASCQNEIKKKEKWNELNQTYQLLRMVWIEIQRNEFETFFTRSYPLKLYLKNWALLISCCCRRSQFFE